MVDLKHPRLQLLIEHDIEAKQLKAAVRLLSLTAPINVLELRLDSDDSLDYDGFNFLPDISCRFRSTRFSFFGRRLGHYAFETIVEAEFMSVIVELVVFLIE